MRQGSICRTVADMGRVLSAVVGYDAQDPFTAFSIGRLPAASLETYAAAGSLAGLRFGVIREYMDVRGRPAAPAHESGAEPRLLARCPSRIRIRRPA